MDRRIFHTKAFRRTTFIATAVALGLLFLVAWPIWTLMEGGKYAPLSVPVLPLFFPGLLWYMWVTTNLAIDEIEAGRRDDPGGAPPPPRTDNWKFARRHALRATVAIAAPFLYMLVRAIVMRKTDAVWLALAVFPLTVAVLTALAFAVRSSELRRIGRMSSASLEAPASDDRDES